MKQLGQFMNEAKATYCGRCGTTHVSPAKGGTCPALKEEDMTTEEADKGIRLAKVMHKGKHVANVTTYRGRGGNWVSGAETPDGQNATKKYGIGMMDTKKEIMQKIKQHHKTTSEEADLDSYADALIKRNKQNLNKGHVVNASRIAGVDEKQLMAAVNKKVGRIKEEAEQVDEISKATMGRYINKAKDSLDMAAYRQGGVEARGSSSRPLERKLSKRHKGIETAVKKLTKEEAEQIDEVSAAKLRDYTAKASDARGHRNLPTAKLDKRYKSMALAHEKIRARHAQVAATEETAKTLSQFIEEAVMNEAHDIELKPHSNGTHYIVHKIHPSSGIEKDQLKVGEKIHDTHVDDLHDMGYSVKIHKK